MKGYKATYDMECRGYKFEVGKVHKLTNKKKLQVCANGFHFCPRMANVMGYYYDREDLVILEVEAVGKCVTKDDKVATTQLKVLRVVPRKEWTFPHSTFSHDKKGRIIKKIDSRGNIINYFYKKNGLLSSMICHYLSNGKECHYRYDKDGRYTYRSKEVWYKDGKKIVSKHLKPHWFD